MGAHAIAALPIGDINPLARILPNIMTGGSIGHKRVADDFQRSLHGSKGKLSSQIVVSVHLKSSWIFGNPICSARKEKNS